MYFRAGILQISPVKFWTIDDFKNCFRDLLTFKDILDLDHTESQFIHMCYLGYVLIPPTNLDSLIWHDSQHLFHFWQIEYWATEDSCKVEYWDLADLHHGIEPNLK